MDRTTREARTRSTASTMRTVQPLNGTALALRLIAAGGICFLAALYTTAILSPSQPVLYCLIAALFTTEGMMLAGLRLLFVAGKSQP